MEYMVTDVETKRITRYLDVRTVLPEQADLVFVFGTRHPEPAYIAAGLIKRGLGQFVVLTGGRNPISGTGEAHTHLGIVLGQGVGRERVIVESESTNTSENVVFAIPKVTERVALARIKSVVVVTKWYHCRRAMMTLKRHLPSGVRYFAASCELEGIRRSNWWQSEEGKRRVLKELDRIPKYLAVGDIEEVQVNNGAFV
jgi:hypothetical protein